MSFQVFNPQFMRRVWAARRAAVEPKKPTLNEIVAAFKRKRRADRQARRRREAATAAQDIRRPPEAPDCPGRESVSSIIRRVAKAHNVPVAAILGARRFRWLVPVRQEAMVEVALHRPDLSLSQIGRAFGKDHTSIIYALRKAGIPFRPLDWRERERHAA